MSLLITEPKGQTFLDRFAQLRGSLRRFQVEQGLAWTAMAGALGLLALVTADFRYELAWGARGAGLASLGIVTLLVFATQVVIPWRWWTNPRTAAEIERRFPSLGQRIRTVVQYAGFSEERVSREGVTPSLVDALEAETQIRAEPLRLDTIVPVKRLIAIAALAALPALVLVLAAASSDEWRIALRRALLFNDAYTRLTVKPGSLTIDQGQSVPIAVELAGRLPRNVVLSTRPVGKPGAPWTSAPVKGGPGSKRAGRIEKVKHGLTYRVTAGSVSSPSYVVRVRYPLEVRSFEVGLVPPSYTRIKPSTVKGGDIRAIAGTLATFRIAFDAPPAEASLVIDDLSVDPKNKVKPQPLIVRLNEGGSAYTADLTLVKSGLYQVVAKTADGRVLPKNRYRIDVRDDRAPRVSFEEPEEALEVHPIAEIRQRIRVGDDFGLVGAGIVFRFNDGEEQTLIAGDFKAAAASDKPTISAALEETLLLERLAASPTDSVTYYAFAEDNDPAGPKRTETDLRYIDIRPFKREYKKGESGDEAGGQSTSLSELIARQRFNLNRSVRLARRKGTDKGVAEDPFKIAGFEETLVGLTREFTEGIEGAIGERVEPLHAAEEAMLASIEALDRGRNADAPKPMAEALRHLISARRTVQFILAEGGASAEAARAFDRTQAQKIRKDKSEKEEAEEVAERLEELAKEEDFVYATLAGGSEPGDPPPPGEAAEKGEEAEKGDEPKPEAKQASKGGGSGKGEGSGQGEGEGKGESGKKGEPSGEETAPKGDPREVAAKQEKIVDELRSIEERLKRLVEASELAKARMAKAAGEAETASNALARGNKKEATESAKAGAAMLHELARQVKGEIARDVADELAMARDLAGELAEREAELGQMPDSAGAGSEGTSGQGGKGSGEKPDPTGTGSKGSPGKGGQRGEGQGQANAERLEGLREAAKTLEEWLKGASLRAEGEAAGKVRDVVEGNPVARIVERMDRVGELVGAGQKAEARTEAKGASRLLEVLAGQLDALHREIISPEIATLVEMDKRVAELMERLKMLKTDAEITEWHRRAAELVRELERAGLADRADELAKAMAAGGWSQVAAAWDWSVDSLGHRLAPDGYAVTLRSVSVAIQDRVQDLVLRDLASARDEAIPPEFKELVERYYEVLSTGVGNQ